MRLSKAMRIIADHVQRELNSEQLEHGDRYVPTQLDAALLELQSAIVGQEESECDEATGARGTPQTAAMSRNAATPSAASVRTYPRTLMRQVPR